MSTQEINAASLAHIDLLDDFIKIAQERSTVQVDPYVRESLGETLDSLRGERQGYVSLLDSVYLVNAA